MIRAAVAVVVAFLALPNVIIVASSFSPTSAFGIPWEGLSLRWYANLLTRPTFGSGLVVSLILAASATLVATFVGVAAAFAIVRYRFVGRGLIGTLVMAPLVVPEVVLGLSFLITFNAVPFSPALLNLLILHVIIIRSEEHTSELQSRQYLVCRLLLEKKTTSPKI